MSKPGKHKYKYDKYKNSGHKELNKQLRADRHAKRLAHFEERKEAGKSYKYDPEKTKQKILDAGYNPNSKYFKDNEVEIRAKLFNSDHRSDLSKLTSTMRKLQNELDKKKLEDKRRGSK